MPQMNIVAPTEYTTKITKFGGVDFASSPSQVAYQRSPECVNAIADERYMPTKRNGYKKAVDTALTGPINGLFRYVDQTGKERILAHAGTKMYEIFPDAHTEPVVIGENMANRPSVSFVFSDMIFFLDGTTYQYFDGEHFAPASERATIPITWHLLNPDGTNGERLYDFNLLSDCCTNQFVTDGTSCVFHVKDRDLEEIKEVFLFGVLKEAGGDYTVNLENGTVTFTAAPEKSNGLDAVEITYRKKASTTNKDIINKCTICDVYGDALNYRVFLSGNADYKNRDNYSNVNDPFYFPDRFYCNIGTGNSQVMGYLKQYSNQFVIKSGNDQDPSQWLRSFMVDDEGNPLFPLQQGAVGAGAISKRCFVDFEDNPLFLSSEGVMMISGTNVNEQRAIKRVSKLIDPKLLKEPNLQNAFAIQHKGKYYLFINNHAYVADGRQVYQDDVGDYQFEWYYWENIPATCALSQGDFLLFGSGEGYVYRFYTDSEAGKNDDGAPITFRWSTPEICFDSIVKYKTIQKIAFLLKRYAKTSANVYISKQDDIKQLIRETGMIQTFDWNDVHFQAFTFETIRNPKIEVVRKKTRKTEFIQIYIENDTLDENFGLLEMDIISRYTSNVR